MALMVSRADIEAARHPDCTWTAEALADAIAARFPGDDDVDLVALIEQWLDDESLAFGTLGECAIIAQQLAKTPFDGACRMKPRAALGRVLKAIAEAPPP